MPMTTAIAKAAITKIPVIIFCPFLITSYSICIALLLPRIPCIYYELYFIISC